jgi:ribosome-associated protein
MRARDASPKENDVLEPPSKTRRKQEMHELQDLGEALVALDAQRLASLDLPERLADAIKLARTVTRHEARRRQLQYIGRLMRDVDAEPLRAALLQWSQGSKRERTRFALLERWRDRVLQDAGGVQAFVDAYPLAQPDLLARLAAAARDERARGGPPHKSRALFRELKRVIDQTPGEV